MTQIKCSMMENEATAWVVHFCYTLFGITLAGLMISLIPPPRPAALKCQLSGRDAFARELGHHRPCSEIDFSAVMRTRDAIWMRRCGVGQFEW